MPWAGSAPQSVGVNGIWGVLRKAGLGEYPLALPDSGWWDTHFHMYLIEAFLQPCKVLVSFVHTRAD